MDAIGVSSITVYKSTDQTTWYYVETYSSDVYTNLMATGKISHASSITHNGTAGLYYRAYVIFYASKDGVTETRSKWSTIKLAI